MSQRHFQALAYALHLSRPERDDEQATQTWTLCVRNTADACNQSNVRFDRDRFIAACNADRYTPAMHGH